MKEIKKITIKEAIELELISQKELTKQATDYKLGLVNDKYRYKQIADVVNAIRNDELRELGYFSHDSNITFYLRDPENLHRLRAELRRQLGQWSDEIRSTYVSGDDLEVFYRLTKDDMFPCDFGINCAYPLANLPAGLLKPTCKIVESTSYSVECELS